MASSLSWNRRGAQPREEEQDYDSDEWEDIPAAPEIEDVPSDDPTAVRLRELAEKGLVGKGRKYLGKGEDGSEVFEYDAEHAPAFVPQDEEGRALFDSVSKYRGATLGHLDRPFRVNRDADGKIESYSTAELAIVPEPDLNDTFSVVPMMWRGKDGEVVSAANEEEAAQHYRETELRDTHENGKKVGERFGNFNTLKEAQKAAEDIHNLHSKAYKQKWNQYLLEHWDELSDSIKNDEGLRKAHAEWEKAGKPGIRFSRSADADKPNYDDPNEWEDFSAHDENIGILEHGVESLAAATGKDYSKGEAALLHVAPFARNITGYEANRETANLERLRTGDYKDDELKDLMAYTGLDHYEAQTLAGNSKDKLRNIVGEMATEKLVEKTKRQQSAEAILDAKPLTTWGKIASGAIENSGYVAGFIYGSVMLPAIPVAGASGSLLSLTGKEALKKIGVEAANSVIGSIPQAVVGGMERASGLANKSYDVDELGQLQTIDDNYDTLMSALRGGAGSVAENTIVEGLTDSALQVGALAFSRIPGVSGVIKALARGTMRTGAGRLISRIGRFYNDYAQFTHLHSIPGEQLEEVIQPIFDDVIGLDKRKGEKTDTFGKYYNKTFTSENQLDIFLGLIGTMELQGGAAVGGAVAHSFTQEGRTEAERIKIARNGLIEAHADPKMVNALTNEEALNTWNAYKLMLKHPDAADLFAKGLSERQNEIFNALRNDADSQIGRDLEQLGIERKKFKIPTTQGADGKPQIAFQEQIMLNTATGKTLKARMVTDEESGVSIIDNGKTAGAENAYTVVDPRTGMSYDCANINAAQQTADIIIGNTQLYEVTDAMKVQFMQREIEQKYGGAKVFAAQTIDDAINFCKQNGVDITQNRNFNKSRKGWRMPDGTIVIVRDNINDALEFRTLMRHEAVGHSGKLMQVQFLDAANKSQIGMLRNANLSNAMQLGLIQSGTQKRIERESVANTVQARSHHATAIDRAIAGINKILGRKMGDAEMEIAAEEVERQLRNSGSGSLELAPIARRVIERLGTTNTEASNEAGNESHEEPAQPEPPAQGGQKAPEKEPPAEVAPRTSENAPTSESGATDAQSTAPTSEGEEAAPEASSDVRKEFDELTNGTSSNEVRKSIVDNASDEEVQSLVDAYKKAFDSMKNEDYDAYRAKESEVVKAIKEREAKARRAAMPRKQASADEVIAQAKVPFNDAERVALEKAADVEGLEAPDEAPTDTSFLGTLSADAPIVRLNPANVDRSDAVLPNMKKDANRTTGITKPLEGEYHPTMAGIGAAWLTKDGKIVVITGRHRSELAQRKGRSMLYYLYREADGFTKEMAQIYDAVANIHDEKGNINDYLGFLDHVKPTREQAEKAGILYGKGLTAWSLYADATEAVRSATALDGSPKEGQITPAQATTIAQAAQKNAHPRNAFIQSVLLRTAKSTRMGADAFVGYCREMTRQLQSGKVNKNLLEGQQMDLFQDEEFLAMEALTIARNKYRQNKSDIYAQIATNLRAALNRSGKLELTDEYAKDLGVTDKTDKKQLEKAYETALERATYWNPSGERILDKADTEAMDAAINAKADATAAKNKALKERIKAKIQAKKEGKPLPKEEKKPEAKKPEPKDSDNKARVYSTTQILTQMMKKAREEGGDALKAWVEKLRILNEMDLTYFAERIHLTPTSDNADKPLLNELFKRKYGYNAESKTWRHPPTTKDGKRLGVEFTSSDGVNHLILGYYTPGKGDIAVGREVVISHKTSGVLSVIQEIRGTIAEVASDGRVKVSYKDGMGYNQSDWFKSSEVVGVMWLPPKKAESDSTRSSADQWLASLVKDKSLLEKLIQARPSNESCKLAVTNIQAGILASKNPGIDVKRIWTAASAYEQFASATPSDKKMEFSSRYNGRLERIEEELVPAAEDPFANDDAKPAPNAKPEAPKSETTNADGTKSEPSATPKQTRKRTVVMKNAEDDKALDDALNDFYSPELDGKTREKQTALSGGTSRNQNPAGNEYGKKWHIFKPGTRNVDIGAGRFDKATKFLADIGVTNLPFDPVNRTRAENESAANAVRENPADTATVHNVLNVIDNDKVMDGIINQAARAIKKDGWAIFTVYEGNRSGKATPTRDGYQRNAKASAYVPSIQKYFGDVQAHGNVITARKPKDVGPAFWAYDSSFENGVDFMSEEFDPEVFSRRCTAAAKVVKILNRDGKGTFENLCRVLAERKPEKYEELRPYLRGVWNAVAEQLDAPEVSKDEAKRIYGIIDANNLKENTNDEGMGGHGTADDVEPAPHAPVRPDNRDGESQGGDARTGSPSNGDGRPATALLGGEGRDGQAVSVERPEVGDGTVSAGNGGDRPQQEDGAATGGQSGRGDTHHREGASGKQRELDLETGHPNSVDDGRGGNVSGSPEQKVAESSRTALEEQQPNVVKQENYIITDEDERAIEGGKPLDKVRTNVEAIRIVRKLAEEGRDATPEEKKVLARYVGWGGLRAAFDNTYRRAYEREQAGETLSPQAMAVIRKTALGEEGYKLYKSLRELLSDKEIVSAENSTTSAFFTPIRLCRSIHKALAAAGLKGGRFLETSAGIGNLIGTGVYANPRWTAVELDEVTGQILKALYPKANVSVQGFEDILMPDNFMDAAISNVPFGTEHPFDPNYKKYGFVVHDFFFAKALDKIHPGGVMAFVTATGTLDKQDKKLIRYLSEHGGKIVGAVRIPNGFFAKNAGTNVATDVVFIQKVEGKADNSVFLNTAEHLGCPISQYFLNRPDLCIGEMVAGTNQFGSPELSYKATNTDYDTVDKAIQRAAQGLKFTPANEMLKAAPAIDVPDSHNLRNGNIGVVDGKIVRKQNGVIVEIATPGVTAGFKRKFVTPQKIVRGIEALRNAQRAIIDAQLRNCSDEELKKLQDALNLEYSTFVSRYGTLHSPLIRKYVELDYAAGPLLFGLEKVEQAEDALGRTSTTITKSDIFSKRTIFAKPLATSAANVMDGLRISLNERGTVDTARIAELTGKDEEAVKKELIDSGLVFVNPETSGLETRDEYLSGAVRRKLKAAQAAAKIDSAFEKNVKELEKVQPVDVAATDITYQLGQNWIPIDVYERFFIEKLFQNTAPHLKVSFAERDHLWHVDDAYGSTVYDNELNGVSMADLLERTMNGRSIVVRKKIDDEHFVVDAEATKAAKIVQEKIGREFQSWMTDDVEMAKRLERIYNDTMNDCVPRQYDTSLLEFQGLSKEWSDRVNTKGREYQKRCVARGTFGGNLLIAHCVGAGKTFEMASICMQLRRLGIARKPMFVVPNHMLAQWNREFHEAYPGANVLIADKKDLAKNKRREFLARVTNGDWDCVVVAHSAFTRIAMSPEHQAEYIEAEIKDLTDLMFQVKSEKDKKKIRKQIQSRRDKMKALLDPTKKDDAIRFEETGCDYLFVDEAHNFKGLDIHTHMSSVPGVTGSVSQRAQDLEMKCRYIAKLHGGDKGVVFATGTPISNSVSEMYTMMRFLAPKTMGQMGITHFDDWAKQFGKVVNEWAPNPSGVGFREKARFSQFQNVPEMKLFFRSFTDVVLDSELDIKRPYMLGGKPIQHVLAPSSAQKAYVNDLNRRMERMQKERVDPTVDNMLKITTEGRLLAIDPALIGVKDDSHTRANACADEVKRIYDKSTGKVVRGRDGKETRINGTQLIFCDSGVPKKKQFKGLVRSDDGSYRLATGYWSFTVTAPDNGSREAYGERVDGSRVYLSGFLDHSVEGREDLASVYTSLEALQMKAGAVNEENKLPKGTKKAKKVAGTPIDINDWLDLHSEEVGYDPRFRNPYAAEVEEKDEDADSDEDASEANEDFEVDNMLRGKFNMYAEMRKQLIKRGIPKEEIAFIHDAETTEQKQKLFDRVRKGEIRVLIGNTAKMGEGTNVQDRLVAIHHLDIPWKPAWLTQRNGRGIRSGNLNDEIGIHTYITEGTFDVYSWDTVGRKAKFIESAMNGNMEQRVIEDVDSSVMSLEEAKAAAAGDPRILERVKLIKRIEDETMAFETQVKAVTRTEMDLRYDQSLLDKYEKQAKQEHEAVERFNAAKGGKPFTLMTAEDEPKALTDNKEIAAYIQDRLGFFARKGSYSGYVGTLFGLGVRYKDGTGGKYLSVDGLDVSIPVTILLGKGAVFAQSDLSKLKSAVSFATNGKHKSYAEKQVEWYKNNLFVARKAAERLAGFDRDAASRNIGEMTRELAHLNKALGIKDKQVREAAERHVQDLRNQKATDLATAVAVAAPVEDGSVYAEVPPEARLRVMENEMAEADFDSPELSPEAEAYVTAEDKTPTEEVSRTVFGMTNDDIATEMRALNLQPPAHEKKSDDILAQQVETLLSRHSYMAKLAHAVRQFKRPVKDYEIVALGEYFYMCKDELEDRQSIMDDLLLIPKDERDEETVRLLAEAREDLKIALARVHEAGLAKMGAASEQGRGLRANRMTFAMGQNDYSLAGIVNSIGKNFGSVDKIPPEMLEQAKELANEFRDLNERQRAAYTARLKAFSEKIVAELKSNGRRNKASERKMGDEEKRVVRNYLDAMAQIEVHADEAGGTLLGLGDQMYPSWGRWLKAIGEYHCFMNPNITEEEVMNAIVNDVSRFLVGVDANQVRDAMTGFGHNFRQSRYDSQRLMNDLRSQARAKRQLDYMNEKNQLPPATGMVRDDPSADLRKLNREVQERKKEVDEAAGGQNRLKGALQSAKTRLRNRIEDLEEAIATGEKIERSTITPVEDEEIRRLRARRDELREIYDEMFKTEHGKTEEQRIKAVEQALMRELERTLEDLARAKAGNFAPRAKPSRVNSETADELRQKIAEVKDAILELKSAKYKYGLTPEEIAKKHAQRFRAREAAILRAAERIEKGDLRRDVKPQPPMSEEDQKRYDEMGRQLKKAHQKLAAMRLAAEENTAPSFWRKGKEWLKFFTAAQRAVKATLDFSAVLRQAARISLAHPAMALSGFGKAWQSMKDEVSLQAVNDEIMSDESVKEAVEKYGLHLREIDALNNRDVEMFHGMESSTIKIFGKEVALVDIPFFGKLMLKSERHYITYLNAVSAELYSAIVNDTERFPGGATPWQKKMLCDMINIWNGSGALSKQSRQAVQGSGLNEVFWAPGLAISRIQSAIGYDVWHPLVAKGVQAADKTFTPVSTDERKTMAKLGLREHVKSSLAMLALGALLRFFFADDDEKDKWDEADWFERLLMLGSPTIGSTTIDLTGGERSIYRLLHDVIKGEKKSASGRTQKLGEGYGAPDFTRLLSRFAEGKLSPWMSELLAIINGKDYVGEEFTLKKAVVESIVPLTFTDLYEQVRETGILKSLITIPLTLLGAGGSTYDRKPYENAVNPFSEALTEYREIENDENLDENTREEILANIRSSNPLMRDDVRELLAEDLRSVNRSERMAKASEKRDGEPDEWLVSQIEREKKDLLNRIRAAKRR